MVCRTSRTEERTGCRIRVLLTGGAGFIGSYIADSLLARDHEVTIEVEDRRPLHRPAARLYRSLRRRARPRNPAHLPPSPGWSPDGHRSKAPLEYGRARDKMWVFGALRVEDGKALTFTSRSRNSKGYVKLLQKIERAIPQGLVYVIAGNLRTRKSAMVGEWLQGHPRIEPAFIPKGAAWLNLIEVVWWRLFRQQALAGRDLQEERDLRPNPYGGRGRRSRLARSGPGF